MNSRQADQASTEPRETHTRGSMSVGGAIARGTEHPSVNVPVVGSIPAEAAGSGV